MKKRLMLLIILILLTCGCSATYDLTIDETNHYLETLTLASEGNEDYTRRDLFNMYLEEYPIYDSQEFLYYAPTEKKEGNTYYIKNITSNSYGYVTTHKATFDNDSYKDSRILKNSFKDTSIGYNISGDYYYLDLSGLKIFKAQNYISGITVNIKVSDNYVVINNNASSINGNTYTWTFTGENSRLILNYQDKEVYNEKKKKQEENKSNNPITPTKEVTKEEKTNTIIIAVIGLLVYILLMIIILRFRNIRK